VSIPISSNIRKFLSRFLALDHSTDLLVLEISFPSYMPFGRNITNQKNLPRGKIGLVTVKTGMFDRDGESNTD